MSKEQLIKQVEELVEGKGKLLYLSSFGSHLYGLESPSSDHDYKGVFLPSLDYFYSYNNVKSITVTTGDSKSKNTKDDVDIELYTLQYFIHKLLSKGDTGALDLLYSVTNKDKVIYGYENMCLVKANIHKILDIKNANAFTSYALGQAKKYGIKGTRLGVLKNIRNFLRGDSIQCLFDIHGDSRLELIADEIIKSYGDKSYCFHKQENCKGSTTDYLCVCGSMHQYNITIKEFCDRIIKAEENYGNRTKKAGKDGGVDYKALSHAIRALYQTSELFRDGKITFPFTGRVRDDIFSIKQGKWDYETVEKFIIELLGKADSLKEKCSLDWSYDYDHCIRLVRHFYREYYRIL